MTSRNCCKVHTDPYGSRVRRDIHMRKSSATVLDDHEDVEQSEGRGDGNEEVTRHNWPGRPEEFHLQSPTDPYVNLSAYTARASPFPSNLTVTGLRRQ